MKNQKSQIVSFLQSTYKNAQATNGVIAVSGGIDSALSLTLLTHALGSTHIFPILLPYNSQAITDNQAICDWNGVPKENVMIQNIGPLVDAFCEQLHVGSKEPMRRGNIMARVRMIMVYDRAKALHALVCGTENKSEKYLGYFTRFGDEASDVEPLQHLYKSQVRNLARELGIPEQFLSKAPSAGLWEGQTDETELGFSYEQADQVIAEHLSEKTKDTTLPEDVRKKISNRIASQHFKHEVPYTYAA